MRLKNTSRLAGDRDAVGGCVGIEGHMVPQASQSSDTCRGLWFLPEPCLSVLVPVHSTASPLKMSFTPFSNVSKDIKDFDNIVRLLEPQNSVYQK